MDYSIFHIIGSAKWRSSASLRDVIDLFIVAFLDGNRRGERVANVASISEFLGISRATATRRIQYLVKQNLVRAERSANSQLISLTAEGAELASLVLGEQQYRPLPAIPKVCGHSVVMRKGRHAAIRRNGRPDAEQLFAVLSGFQQAIASHMKWLVQWYHRLLNRDNCDLHADLCGESCQFSTLIKDIDIGGVIHNFEKILFDHAEVHRCAQDIGSRVLSGRNITEADFESLVSLIMTFATSAQQAEREVWQVIATIDPLTGLGNRHFMMSRLETERVRSIRQGQPCCIAIADIDHFKDINDVFGHAQGDRMLRAVAEHLQRATRPYDLLFRYGGEEFLICLPGTSLSSAVQILERIRLTVAEVSIPHHSARPITATCTFGVSEIQPHLSLEDVIEQADMALYEGKRLGRNMVSALDLAT